MNNHKQRKRKKINLTEHPQKFLNEAEKGRYSLLINETLNYLLEHNLSDLLKKILKIKIF